MSRFLASIVHILAAASVLQVCTGCPGRSDKKNMAQNTSNERARSMSAERVDRLQKGLGTIRIGDSVETVVAAVGEPDEKETVGPKRPHNPGQDLREFVYDVSLKGSDRGNIDDRVVTLSFDSAGKLVSISSNVDGIDSRHK
jgi:hypothetical protein